jgi:hypothetical protein
MDKCEKKICYKHGELTSDLIQVREGRGLECRLCIRERAAAWRVTNPEKAAAIKHATYQRNKARILKRQKEYVKKNRDRVYHKRSEWAKANPERVNRSKRKHRQSEHGKQWYDAWREENKEKLQQQRHDEYERDKPRQRSLNRVYIADHREQLRAASKKWREENKVVIARKKKTRMDRMRLAAISHYSEGKNACKFCNISDISKLCLDHIDESGAIHRRDPKTRTTHSLLEWFNKHGYCDGFQVLCWNCNWLKHLKPCNSAQARCNRKLKQTVLDHYCGGPARCVLCGTDDLRILTIDHVDGGGKKHRSSHKLHGGPDFYRWLRDQGFPSGYRVLCFNCNCGPST